MAPTILLVYFSGYFCSNLSIIEKKYEYIKLCKDQFINLKFIFLKHSRSSFLALNPICTDPELLAIYCSALPHTKPMKFHFPTFTFGPLSESTDQCIVIAWFFQWSWFKRPDFMQMRMFIWPLSFGIETRSCDSGHKVHKHVIGNLFEY